MELIELRQILSIVGDVRKNRILHVELNPGSYRKGVNEGWEGRGCDPVTADAAGMSEAHWGVEAGAVCPGATQDVAVTYVCS